MATIDITEQLTNSIATARTKRLATVLDPEDDPTPQKLPSDHQQDILLGDCARNAVVLARTLAKNWTRGPVRIRTGILDYPHEPLPDSVPPAAEVSDPVDVSKEALRTARSCGILHHWVEAVDSKTDTRYICEIAREAPADRTSFGEPCLKQILPEGYIPTSWTYAIDDLNEGACPFDRLVLWNAIRTARDSCLEDHGVDEDQSHYLRGYCHDHAAELVLHLAPAWDGTNLDGQRREDCYVQYGSVTRYDYVTTDPEEIETAVDVADAGGDHYWVEATLTDSTDSEQSSARYTADIWAHTEAQFGAPLVTQDRPEAYAPAEQARMPYDYVLRDEDWYKAHL